MEIGNITLRDDLPYPYNLAYSINERLSRNGKYIGEVTPNTADKMVVDCLGTREREILWYVLRDHWSFADVGRRYNVTRERIRQVLAESVRKLVYCDDVDKYTYVPYIRVKKAEARVAKIEMLLGELRDCAENDTFELLNVRAFLNEPVENSSLSVRAIKCLKRNGMNTFGDIAKVESESYLRSIPNLGEHTEQEILDYMHSHGAKLKWEE